MTGRRLETALRIRRLQERLASVEVANQRRRLASAKLAEAGAWEAVARCPLPAIVSADAFRAHRGVLDGGVAAATALGGSTAAARSDVDDALDALQHSARRRDGLERLGERIAADDRAVEEHRTAVEADELAVTRWNRGRS